MDDLGRRGDAPWWSLATGATYDPQSRRWREVPASPLSARAGAEGVWTGEEVIILGGFDEHWHDDAAAYDPAANRWRKLAPFPSIAGHGTLGFFPVWIGSRLLVWRLWEHTEQHGNAYSGADGYDLASLDPSRGAWQLITQGPDAATGISQPAWTGSVVVVPGTPAPQPFGPPPPGPFHPSLYDPATNRWRTMADPPTRSCCGASVWIGNALVTNGVAGDPMTVWDRGTNSWSSLPAAPLELAGAPPIWTGRELFFWGRLRLRGSRTFDGHAMSFGA